MIKCTGLAYAYGAREVLHDVSFSVQKGSICGILGPNGSGKTTLFHLLSTRLPALRGTIMFGETLLAPHNFKKIRRKIGIVFQSPSLDKKLTVHENLRFQGSLYGFSGNALRTKIDEAMGRFGLSTYRHELVEKLSGGWARRVEIVKSMLHEPDVLLLDEPSSGLDPLVRMELFDLLRTLSSEGCTILLTTHFLEEADQCDGVIMMHDGRVLAHDHPSQLKGSLGKKIVFLKTKSDQDFSEVLGDHADLKDLKMTNRNGTVRLEIPEQSDLIERLTTRHKDKVVELSYRSPNLEDVFLHFSGGHFFKGASQNA